MYCIVFLVHLASDKPGLCKSAKCTIVLSEHATPVSQQGRNIPVGIEQAVKKELTKLLDEGKIKVEFF